MSTRFRIEDLIANISRKCVLADKATATSDNLFRGKAGLSKIGYCRVFSLRNFLGVAVIDLAPVGATDVLPVA